jgi:hypothetical protein
VAVHSQWEELVHSEDLQVWDHLEEEWVHVVQWDLVAQWEADLLEDMEDHTKE